MPDLGQIRKSLQRHGQSHLLAFHDQLSPAEQAGLLEQISALNLAELDPLIRQYVLAKSKVGIEENLEPPPVIPARPTDPSAQAEQKEARKRGEDLIAQGKVAAFVVAGGQGTRLGYEGPKGCLESTPVTHKPLFKVFAEQILAASRRHRVTIPWYVMTSPANDVATRAFFRQNGCFGLNPKDVIFLVQGMMPAFDFQGKILLEEKGRLALSPDGHGGSLPALRKSGALEDMARRGIELISYFQVDNPLVRCVDPLFLGLHEFRGAQMSAKALPKRDPMERVGNFCRVDGKVKVIEYSDLPEELARATMEDGRLRFWAGSIAIHVLSRSFVEQLTAGGGCELPFHRAEKKAPFVDPSGRPVKPEQPNAIKLERFVFDALPLARNVVILETLRSEEFSSIKNAGGEDSPATSLHDQVRRAATWLEQAGVTVPRDADGQVAAAIEISPLFADSAEALAKKMDRSLRIAVGQNLYLGE